MKKLLKVILVFLFLVISNITYAQQIESLHIYQLEYNDFYLENIDYGQKEIVSNIFEMRNCYARKEDIIYLCTKGISKYPQEPTFYLLRGYFYLENDNIKAGISDLSKSIQLDPDFSPIVYYLRANAYSEEKNFKNAAMDFMTFYKLIDSRNKCLKRSVSDRWYRHMILFSVSGALCNLEKIKYIINGIESNVRNRNTPYTSACDILNKTYKDAMSLIEGAEYALETLDQPESISFDEYSIKCDIQAYENLIKELTILNNAKKY